MHDYLISALILLTVSVVGLNSVALYIPATHALYESLYHTAELLAGVDMSTTTKDFISSHGYPAEHHHIVTEDGYVLGVFRIPYSHKLKNQEKIRPIVLIEHGLMGGSDIWFFTGPNHALPYLLVDSGFDVWVGNSRGNTYSRNHISMSTEDPDFWKFSWHEIGYYDIAATIDYSLQVNGQGHQAVHYVGHSQGTTVFFALMSMRPEYNAKIKTAQLMAPVAWMSNMEYKLVHNLSPYLSNPYNLFTRFMENMEFLPYNKYVLRTFANVCGRDQIFRPVCVYLINSYYNSTRWNNTAMTEGFGHQPAGCSSNQIIHYMQEYRSGRFCQYDYGSKINKELYGSAEPPDYPVQLITSKVHLWYAQNDIMAAVKDVNFLAERLPNRELHLVDDPLWDHDDFALNVDLRKVINDPVIEIMKKFESSKN